MYEEYTRARRERKKEELPERDKRLSEFEIDLIDLEGCPEFLKRLIGREAIENEARANSPAGELPRLIESFPLRPVMARKTLLGFPPPLNYSPQRR